jgi:hypothetical protein
MHRVIPRRVFMLTIVVCLAVGAAAEAQRPAGYWLYVNGVWKSGFVTQDACLAAARTMTGRVECRSVTFAQTVDVWNIRPLTGDADFDRKILGTYATQLECLADERAVRARLREVFGRVFPFGCMKESQ